MEPIEKALYGLFGASLHPMENFGVGIFYLAPDNSLRFSLLSRSIIRMSFRAFAMFIVSVYQLTSLDLLGLVFRFGQSPTEIFVLVTFAANIIFSELIVIMIMILRRNKFIQFHGNLTEFLKDTVNPNTPTPLQQFCLTEITRGQKLVSVAKKVICCFIVFTAIGIFFVCATSDITAYWESSWNVVMLPLITSAWGSEFVTLYMYELWMVSLLHCLKVAAGVVHLKSLDKPFIVVESLGQLEKLLHQFNQTFGMTSAVHILSLLITIIVTLCQSPVMMMQGFPEFLFGNIFKTTLSVCIIFVICNKATHLETEVRQLQEKA